MAQSPPQAGLVPAATLAKLFGLTERRIQQLAADGTIPKSERGEYPLAAAIQGYIRSLKDDLQKARRGDADERYAVARATEAELRAGLRASSLITADEAFSVLDEVVGLIRAGLDGLGARLTQDRALRDRIDSETDDLLRRAADRLDETAAAVAARGAAAAAAAAPAPGPLGEPEPDLSAELGPPGSA